MFIIQITAPDDTITDHVGPFTTEEDANVYCMTYLEPKLEHCTFLLTELAEPEAFKIQLSNSNAVKN